MSNHVFSWKIWSNFHLQPSVWHVLKKVMAWPYILLTQPSLWTMPSTSTKFNISHGYKLTTKVNPSFSRKCANTLQCTNQHLWKIIWSIQNKAIQMIYRLFLVTAMYCQASFFSITQPLRSFSVLAGWEGSLGTCSR